jgi:hypothetical protein
MVAERRGGAPARGVVLGLLMASAVWVAAAGPGGQAVPVRHREGLVHGFLVLTTLEGKRIATGDLIQTTRGDRVTSRLVFHFRDGSLYDETAVYSQRGRFRLIRDRLIERGPSFPHAIDMSVDAATGAVTVRYDDDGKEKTESDRLDPIPELANGLILTLLKNVGSRPPQGLSMVVATPKPRVVRLAITVAGRDSFATGGAARKATHFVIKAEIGGLTGALAKLLGKEPPDSHVWILPGEAPAFIRSEQPMYAGGPLWRIELVSPAWPRGR